MRHPRYDSNLEAGHVFEDFVGQQLLLEGICLVRYRSIRYQCDVGENAFGMEIKHDMLLHETNNLFIEYEERPVKSAEWKPAGILRNDNAWLYAIGDYTRIFIFGIKVLQRFHERRRPNGEFWYEHKETPTAKGLLLKAADGERIAEKYIVPCSGPI